LVKRWPLFLQQPELLEGYYNARTLRVPLLASTYAYPIDLSVDFIAPRLGPKSANTDDGVEIEEPNSAHAIIDSEAATRVGIANVCTLVGQNAHAWLGLRHLT
jgi:hypothetical protein